MDPLPGDRVGGRYGNGRQQQQQHHQLSVLGHHGNSFADDALTLESAAAASERSIRHRSRENLI